MQSTTWKVLLCSRHTMSLLLRQYFGSHKTMIQQISQVVSSLNILKSGLHPKPTKLKSVVCWEGEEEAASFTIFARTYQNLRAIV